MNLKRLILLSAMCLAFLTSNAKIRAYLSYATFNTPAEGAYMETYLSVNGSSVKYQKLENGKFQAKIEIIFTFERNDSIKSFQKILLNSPEIADTTRQNIADFIDVQRFAVPVGIYNFNISLRDLNANESEISSTEKIVIQYPNDKVGISGIQVIEKVVESTKASSLTKLGYDLYPYFSNFYPDYIKNISFYYEVYNTKNVVGDGSNYITKYYIEDATSHQKAGQYSKQKNLKSSLVDVNFGNFNIATLPSGNYNLVVEVLDTNNQILAFNALFFQRSNPSAAIDKNAFTSIDITNTFVTKITNFDTLRQYIDYLYPIFDDNEKVAKNSIFMDQKQNMDSIIISKEYKNKQLILLQQYFLDFWVKRNAQDPEKEWDKYKEQVDKVNKLYASLRQKGYLSDRGRVYLQYGAPNSVSAETMGADSYPYEIWHYYQIKSQGNRKFIFYNIDRVSNSYELLHSDVFGEMNEPEWEKVLRNRRQNQSDHDTKISTPVWGDRSRDYWNNPR